MPAPLRVLVLYAVDESRRTLSYQQGWPAAFADDPRFDAAFANVATRFGRLKAHAELRLRSFDTIVLLHSVLSNAGVIEVGLMDAIAANPAKKAYFLGNEYKLMVPKMELAERINVSLLISMSSSERVHALYRERLGCTVVCIPSAGLDPAIFYPATDLADRPIDLGMRAYAEPWYFGHGERRQMGDWFVAHAVELGLVVDVSFEHEDRFTPKEYAAFLNQCRGQLGTEAGSDYFDITDTFAQRATLALHALPRTPDDIPAFYGSQGEYLPLRVISGRHVEAAGTKTVQILFEGEYNGFFQPDVHYLALQKDFSNVDDVLARFRDDGVCREIADNAYRVAIEELTYERLLGRFLDALRPLLS